MNYSMVLYCAFMIGVLVTREEGDVISVVVLKNKLQSGLLQCIYDRGGCSGHKRR